MRACILLIIYFSISILNGLGQEDARCKRAFMEGMFYYEFSILAKEPKIQLKKDVEYFWYKSDKIHSSFYGVGGRLLNGQYRKTHTVDKSLIEKGNFKNGMKVDKWKEWYPNGKLKTIVSWSNGKKEGSFVRFDMNGNILEKGNYNNNRKNGKWINFNSNDTIFYNNGEKKNTKLKKDKSFFRKLFKKRDNIQKVGYKNSKKKNHFKNKKVTDTVKKEGFFKRLFRKKD